MKIRLAAANELFIPLELKCKYLLEIANGLGFAHHQGVAHRDIKPSNIRILADHHIKIIDFRLATLTNVSSLAESGCIVGTPAYMAPERWRSESRVLDVKADVFSYGVLAYELLVGYNPFRIKGLEQTFNAILYEDPFKDNRQQWSKLPLDLHAIVRECLEKDPEDRIDLTEALDRLRQFCSCRAAAPKPTDSRQTIGSAIPERETAASNSREGQPKPARRTTSTDLCADHPRERGHAENHGQRQTAGVCPSRRPIRILHLSDLHFTADTVPETKLQWLDDDIRKGSWLEGGEVDYVVISGDMTHQGSDLGFQRASRFVSLLVERFGLSAERFVLVPGNHDVQDSDESYQLRTRLAGDERQRAVELKGKGVFLVPHPEEYPLRLKAFSDQFYHPVLQKPYPLDSGRQGVAYIFPETRLQFLTLNSCWEIDQFHRTRASVHPDALARLIAEADRQIQQAIVNTDVKPEDYLRIGVWHHPVADAQRGIRNREFLSNLQKNRVRVCLTGDVHEMRRELIDYWHDKRMHVVGAGSFCAKGQDLREGSPRLYNLLEIDREFRWIRVHTRRQPKPDGAWDGWHEWPDPKGGQGRLPFFDIDVLKDDTVQRRT